MRTMDVSNLVVLFDGVKNNHDIELLATSHRRVNKVLAQDANYAFFLRDSDLMHKGKYIFNELEDSKIWIIVSGYGDFSKEVNSETIEIVKISTLKIGGGINYGNAFLTAKRHLQAKETDRECFVLDLIGQDILEASAKSIHKTTIQEIICSSINSKSTRSRISTIFRKSFFAFTQRTKKFLFETFKKSSSSPTKP